MDPRGGRPNEIVLLEDNDLYRYHAQQTQHGMRDLEAPGYDAYHHQPPSQMNYARSGMPMRANASFHPASDVVSERSEGPRQYQQHRTPYAPSTVRKPSMASVDTIPMTHGALRPGGAVNLFSRQYIGLLLNWTLVGFFNGSISALVPPVFEFYLGYSDYQSGATAALLNVPWLFKFLMGFLSDCFPIRRQRRKPYIFIGWVVFMLFMVAMTFMNEPRSAEEDENAMSQGPKYVFMLMFGSLGHLLATAALEGMMVEFAQREGEFARGRTQSWCIIYRFVGEFTGAVAVALALNSSEFGGEFASSVPLQVVFGAHAVLAALGLVITKLWLHEDMTSTSTQRLATQLRRIWNIMQKRTTWQITVFGFFAKLGSNYEIPGHNGILRTWLGAETFMLTLSEALASVGFVIAAAVYMKFLLNTNWRKMFVAVFALSIVLMAPVETVTVFNIERSLALYLSKVQLVSVLNAVVFILRVVIIVEVIEPGYEAVTYGVLTTVFNLGSTVTSMCKNVVASQWPKSVTNTKLDTDAVRWHYMRAFIFKYGLRVAVVLLVIKLLPRQKRHLKELNLRGAPNLVIPIVLFVLLAALFVASVTSNMLALFESTACLIFAGGSGCDAPGSK